MKRPVGRWVVVGATLAACVAILFAFAGPISRALVAATFDLATGYRIGFDSLEVRRDVATLQGVVLDRNGEPVLRAERLAVRYRLHDLLPGGQHRFGLRSFDVERPVVTLVRHADGTFNVTPAAFPIARAPVNETTSTEIPIRIDGTIRDGRVEIDDRFRVLPESRRLVVGALVGRIAIDTAARSTYHVTGNFGDDAAQPFALDGRFDDRAGYASHRLRSPRFAIVPIVNYFINGFAARFESGIAHAAEVRLYGFAPRSGAPIAYHLAGTLDLVDGGMRIPGLVPYARAMTGRVDLFDGGLAAPALTATLGDLDLRVAGGLLNWRGLEFRLGLRAANAPLEAVRKLFAFSRDLPLAGAAQLDTFLEGPVALPMVVNRVTAGAVRYNRFPLNALAARAIYYHGTLEVAGLRGIYGGLAVNAEGAIDLEATARSQLVIDVGGPAARVPYLAELAPGAAVRSIALLTGPDLAFDARGSVVGGGAGTTIGGLFHLDARGEGNLGPIAIARAGDSSIVGTFYLDRAVSRSGFWLDARDMPYADLATAARLPGLDLRAPRFAGRLDGSLAGAGPPSDFRIAGRVGGRGLRVGTFGIARATGDVYGRIGNVRLQRVVANGRWGAFAGDGAYVGDGLALRGRYRGSFAQTATLTGDLGGRGPLAGPIALLVDPRRTIVQSRGVASPGARVLGVPIDALAGTIEVAGKHVRLFAATGAVAGGTLVAAGTLDGPRTLGVSAAGVEASRLRALVPLAGDGHVSAIGAFGLRGRESAFDGGLALGTGSSFDREPLEGNGDLTLLGRGIRFSTTDATYGPIYGTLAGSLGALGSRAATFDARAHLLAAPLAPLARIVAPQTRAVVGTVTGDIRLFGTGNDAALDGAIGIPEASINGLAIRDGSARIAIDSRGLSARDGNVTVGSTRADFAASARGTDASLRLAIPHARLADFNDFFDTGDTLGGSGRIAAHFEKTGSAVRTGADIAIAGLTYRRFDLGDATARWNSTGSRVIGAIGFGGASGRLQAAGTLGLPAHVPLQDLLGRSRFDGTASLRGLDLGVWLPALGYQLRVLGRVDADATIAGALRNPDVRTTASLRGGTIGAFPVDRLELAASSTLRRTTVTRAQIDIPSIALTGSGSFGFGERDPIAFAVHATSADVGAVANRLVKIGNSVSGTAEVDVKVSGTRGKPRLDGGFDLESASLRGVKVPRALGQFTVAGRDVVLSSVEVGFATGTLELAGSVPLQVSPFALGPASAPVALELGAKGIELGDFAPLLPAGSKLSGKLAGRVAIEGTAGSPRLVGRLALDGGTLLSPLETYPLTDLAATLAFDGNDARLETLHASAGGGRLDAHGFARFPDLVRIGPDATYRIDAVAKGLRLNFPAYGNGQIDGTLAIAHRPQQLPVVGGNLTLADATIPFAALLIAAPGGDGLAAAPAPPPTVMSNVFGLDLAVAAGNNVRVRSSNVDLGGKGSLHVGGTTADPKLDGGFDSTGGTLTYVNTVFRLLDGRVRFTPDLGLVPTLDARAITHVSDPDPNTLRNIAGSADVTLNVSGPVTNLAIELSSNPAYDREQILGLLLSAPAFGASNLFGETTGAPTLYGSTTPAGVFPGTLATRSSTGQFSVAQEAFGVANAQFTRTLLAPIETSFAQAVGLSNFNVNVDYTGAVGVTARKVLGKTVNAVYGTSFGYPYRQTVGFEIKPSPSTVAQVTVFQTLGATGLTSLTPPAYQGNNLRFQNAQPSTGTFGFSLSLQRLFK